MSSASGPQTERARASSEESEHALARHHVELLDRRVAVTDAPAQLLGERDVRALEARLASVEAELANKKVS